MTKGQKIGAVVGAVLVLGWIGGSGDAPEQTAPAPAPEPTPAPEPEAEPALPMDFGDDAALDRLWTACAAGDEDACYDLWWDSPVGSEYQRFADEQIEQIEERTGEDPDDAFAQLLLEMVWGDMTRAERQELCSGYFLLGGLEAGQLVAESSGGTVTAQQAADFFSEVCRG